MRVEGTRKGGESMDSTAASKSMFTASNSSPESV
jgi:hypothetical protein